LKISFSTIAANLNLKIGYGLAGYNMVTALQRLGHQVPFQDPTAPVEIAFNQPNYTEWSSEDQYKIQYTPWESTALPLGWLEGFNSADEVWTPSPIVARWYQNAGVTVPVKVYQHGIDPEWAVPERRASDGVLRFLHHGEPAPRKGGQMALDAFRAAFGDDPRVHLTIKSYGETNVRAMSPSGRILGPADTFSNVTVVREHLEQDQLIALYKRHHVMVYPGYGEGFGLIPLQAMATGMPTICTQKWAPYKWHITMPLKSTLSETPWPLIHPGKMFIPDFDHLVQLYKQAEDEFEFASWAAFNQAPRVAEEYNWDRLTEQAFAPLVERFG
jgi:glycosyltransferase involved in cell wall biosynthesis